jgi:hypothetical protein
MQGPCQYKRKENKYILPVPPVAVPPVPPVAGRGAACCRSRFRLLPVGKRKKKKEKSYLTTAARMVWCG